MKWYWKVRIYRPDGQYGVCEVVTDRVLNDIGIIKDFYEQLTGCKMLLEGMSNTTFGVLEIAKVHNLLWEERVPPTAGGSH